METVSQKNLINSIIEMNKGNTTATHGQMIKIQKTDNEIVLKQ